MSPELQRLLEAYDAQRTCSPKEKHECQASFQRLLDDALARLPGGTTEGEAEAATVNPPSKVHVCSREYLPFRKSGLVRSQLMIALCSAMSLANFGRRSFPIP